MENVSMVQHKPSVFSSIHDAIRMSQSDNRSPPNARNFYDFVSGFPNLKEVYLRIENRCCSYLIGPIRRLAENNTIELLEILYCSFNSRCDGVCIFRERSNHEFFDMRKFDNLKKISIIVENLDVAPLDDTCQPIKLLNAYSSQLLTNVEHLSITSQHASDLNFINFAPKLRKLDLDIIELTPDGANEIFTNIESILHKRSNTQTKDKENDGKVLNKRSDFIEIKLTQI